MYRKIKSVIDEYFNNDSAKILCIDGARQVGKTYIIRESAQEHYKNYIEINMADDKAGDQLFANVKNINDFYMKVSIGNGDKMGLREDTVIFLDEIQVYPELFTLLKSLYQDNKYKYICSGSQLGIALSNTTLIPMGSINEIRMYPMDFEEFLYANGVGKEVISYLFECYKNKKTPEESIHKKILDYFKIYLFVGGLPECVKEYVNTRNVYKVREIQNLTVRYYSEDASKYDREHKLKIKRIYDLVPSTIENKVKRIQFKMIDEKEDSRYIRYEDEFDYLLSSGIVLGTKAVSEPKFPLIQSSSKNLIKLYMNDVGLLTNFLYKNQINVLLEDKKGVNLGAVYETVVAEELRCHGHELYYYDRKKVGEVDYLVDDYDNLCVLPLEIKSGKDYHNFRAIPKLVNDNNYNMKEGYILNNDSAVVTEGKLCYMPIYFIMFV